MEILTWLRDNIRSNWIPFLFGIYLILFSIILAMSHDLKQIILIMIAILGILLVVGVILKPRQSNNLKENLKKNEIDPKTLKEYLFEETKIVQDIIKRMASNSFQLKAWTVTLVVATMLLKGTNFDIAVGAIAFIPLLVFWSLDAYFLWQERMYRKLYDWIIANRLQTEEHLFDMDASRFKNEVQSRFRIMFSITLGWFYGSIAVLIASYLSLLYLIKIGVIIW